MNIALWIVAGLLAVSFFLAGLMKATRPKEQLAARMAWAEDFSPATIKFIGTAEALGAVGLILPAVVDVAPILVPLAATGLAIIMVLAMGTHARRKEPQMIVGNVVLFAGAAFVAWGRFGPHSF